METPATPVTRYKQYTASFKIDVINSAKVLNNNSEAGRKHGVDVRNVRRWRAQEESLKAQVADGNKELADGNKKKMRLEGRGKKTFRF